MAMEGFQVSNTPIALLVGPSALPFSMRWMFTIQLVQSSIITKFCTMTYHNQAYNFTGWSVHHQRGGAPWNPNFCNTCCSCAKTVECTITNVACLRQYSLFTHVNPGRVSTTPGNPGNLLECVWSSWKFLCKMSMIDCIGFQSW